MSNPTAALLIIGNEILSGRTHDANIQFLCQRLGEMGIAVREARVIPDETTPIVETVRFLANTYSYVFTTGGIGATHDDITAACLAQAFERPLAIHEEAFQILKNYYGDKLNDARKRMALVPQGSELIYNPISAAPGFQVENVFALAGIPMVMQAMFENLGPRLKKGTAIIHKTITCAVPENNIADELAIIQNRHVNVDIGSYPYFLANGTYGVSLVIRGTDYETINKVAEELVEMVRHHGAHPHIE